MRISKGGHRAAGASMRSPEAEQNAREDILARLSGSLARPRNEEYIPDLVDAFNLIAHGAILR